ncbi:MAG: hypothetical protein O7H41_19480, partial [Planctomycetota bacterium]|nr:hypothetical protein [Planctomycetota bacterium]
MAVWRYLEDGTLDPGFGVGGVFTHHDGAGGGDQDIGRDLMVDANDRIVVTGSSLNAAFGVSMMVWRLTPDGVLDSKLGGGGFVAYLGDDPGPGSASGNALAQDPSGMILVAGTSTVFGPAMTIWRLRDDGGLDPEWGGTGIVAHCIPGWNGGGPQGGEGEDIAIDSQGRVVVAGRTLENSSDMAVWRYRSNGSLDTSFNKQGWITHGDFNTRVNTERAFSVAIDPCGDLLVGGLVWSFEASFAVWRVVDDGRVDPSFGVGGVALMRDPNAAWNQTTTGVQGIVIGPSGQVFVNGFTQPAQGADADMAVVCIR